MTTRRAFGIIRMKKYDCNNNNNNNNSNYTRCKLHDGQRPCARADRRAREVEYNWGFFFSANRTETIATVVKTTDRFLAAACEKRP